MKQSTKILLGVNTLVPLAIIVLLFIYFWNLLFVMEQLGVPYSSLFGMGILGDIFIIYFGSIILTSPLSFFYIIHLKSTPAIPDYRKSYMRLAMLVFPFPVLQIYWFKYIWKEE